MKYLSFEFKNFKGIKHGVVNLERTAANVYTLIGLNESGKTTVLEAIHNFKESPINYPVIRPEQKDTHQDFLRLDEKDNFTGNIELIATIQIDSPDKELVTKFIQDGLSDSVRNCTVTEVPQKIIVSKIIEFEQGDLKNNYFEIKDSGWTLTSRPANPTVPEESYDTAIVLSTDVDIRRKLASILHGLLPEVLYLPNLLSDFPDKIHVTHVETLDDETRKKNDFYYNLINNILKLDNRSIEKHIADRVVSSPDQVQNTLNWLSNRISLEIQNSWNEVFKTETSASRGFTPADRKVEVSCRQEKVTPNGQPTDRYYLSFSIKENNQSFPVRRRSLGFRWFFCFFLFTLFGSNKDHNNRLLLIDEPASNLHLRAQQQLLGSLKKVTDRGFTIVYSTHSHHLINPAWLESTFVIKNKGLNYEKALDEGVISTDIIITPYRSFINENPTDVSYFQPVLNALEYKFSVFDGFRPAVIVEGKSDFYILQYFKEIIFQSKNQDYFFIPGSGGATNSESLIKLYLGYGIDFYILLDGDVPGSTAKNSYKENFLLGDDKLATLQEITGESKIKEIEDLFHHEDYKLFGTNKKDKKKILRVIQENYAKGEALKFHTDTMDNLQKVITYYDPKFKNSNQKQKAA